MRLVLLYLALWSFAFASAHTVIESPVSQGLTSFAIVVDNSTYEATRMALLKYRDAVEADGLSTYIIRGDWNTPDEVKLEIIKVYHQAVHLEGIVLVGDIPVAMIRNAQHLTTAFKMNEETFPFPQSSVPSDRFYDDLHLKFDFIGQDSVRTNHFYYKLSEDSPQCLNPNFYSARIKYPDGWKGDKYVALSDFFIKAADTKKQISKDPLDNIVAFNGGAYNSDCLIAWMDEEKAYRENFPLAFYKGQNFKHLNFRMDKAMKHSLLDELQRPDIDLFMFHEHGLPTKQVINNERTGDKFEERLRLVKTYLYHSLQKMVAAGKNEDSLKQILIEKYHLTDAFFKELHLDSFWKNDSIISADVYLTPEDLSGVATYPKIVLFNACYNGSFQDDDYLAAYYLFNRGNTVVAQGNTRNVLQDRWTIELIGLLSHGVRVGQYNRLIATLEGHLMGDPTARFAPIITDLKLDADIELKQGQSDYWSKLISVPYADIQSLTLRMIVDADSLCTNANEILNIFKSTSWNTVRMEALKLLGRYNNACFTEAVHMGIGDSYELIARHSANYAGEIGDPVLLPALIREWIDGGERQRVGYIINSVLPLFPQNEVECAIDEFYRQTERTNALEEQIQVKKILNRKFAMVEQINAKIKNEKLPVTERIAAIRMLRNNPYHCYVLDYLDLLACKETPVKVRVAMAEALGWFVHSQERIRILEGCRKLLQTDLPDELYLELQQTIKRLI